MLDRMQPFTCVKNTEMRTADNDSILGSQNNNDGSIQMMMNLTSVRQCTDKNLGNRGNSMSDSLLTEEVQLNNACVSNNGNKMSNNDVLDVMDSNNNDVVEGDKIMSPKYFLNNFSSNNECFFQNVLAKMITIATKSHPVMMIKISALFENIQKII